MYQQPHWSIFSAIPPAPSVARGYYPAKWATRFAGAPKGLPTQRLTRTEVRVLCRNPQIPVLLGYLCAMAWGAQSNSNADRVWMKRTALIRKLTTLRAGGFSRSEAYQFFSGAEALPGLGPAYLTKVLYFFSPEANCYIMDQWTAKSVNLLTGRTVVMLEGGYVSNQNRGHQYQLFCEEVETIAAQCKVTGVQAEEMLMASGGPRPSPWRAYLVKTLGE